VVVCPLAELGFIRVSTGALGAPMAETRQLLERFLSERNAGRIADDLPALGSMPKTSGQVTDHYLADWRKCMESSLRRSIRRFHILPCRASAKTAR